MADADSENRSVLASYAEERSEEPDMSVWQAAQMILRYSEYADAIGALRTAEREDSEEQKDAKAGPAAGDQPEEAKRKKRLLQMVASFGVGAKDSTLEHFIAVQDRLKNIKEVIFRFYFIFLLTIKYNTDCSSVHTCSTIKVTIEYFKAPF